MATKKYRADNTYLVDGGKNDNPKLMARVLDDGRESLFLEFYLGFKESVSKNGKVYKKAERQWEQLGLFLWQAPRTPQERIQNKEIIQLAKKIRWERGQELLENKEGYRLKKDRQIDFLEYFQNYVDNYKKKDGRILLSALNRFKLFLEQTPEYNKYTKVLKAEQLNKDMMVDFSEFCQHTSRGEGAISIWKRFKKVLIYMEEHDLIRRNPCKGVTIKSDGNILRKAVLSQEEIKKLLSYNDENLNPEIRKAFILSLYCGIRYCDVKDLTFSNVDYGNMQLSFEQSKTKGHSTTSGVVIPLTEELINLIGKPTKGGGSDERIFKLPTYETCLKSLQKWVKGAGIEKHITWHCARHSFATNILANGADIKTVASLLGHSSVAMTEKYTRVVDRQKEAAIKSLPKLEF